MLRAAAKLVPAHAELEIADISQLPMYDDDLWHGDTSAFPEPVKALRDQVSSADAILFACPEYNYSLTPALKNAIDWCSIANNVFDDKTAAVVGAGGNNGSGESTMTQNCTSYHTCHQHQ